jgi:diguanylate cyclase (GGDEF)-like protein/putative nucleotidyltransferase with HDIG domain
MSDERQLDTTEPEGNSTGSEGAAREAETAVQPPRSDSHPAAEQTPQARPGTLRACRLLVVGSLAAGVAACAFAHVQRPESLPEIVLPGLGAVLLMVAAVLQGRHAREMARLTEAHRRAEELASLNSAVIASFAMAIDAKDQHTHGHTERVRDIATMIAEDMGLGRDEIDAVRTAAMLHDIGKLAVPDYILSKPGQLTEEEMKKIRTHTLVGAAILEPVKFPWPVVPAIRSHHEWLDGSGYPESLANDDIPLGARILAVADVYDALLSHRPYRPAMTVQEAVAFMRARSGTQFDPEILKVCFRVLSSQRAQNRLGFMFNADGSGLPPRSSEVAGQHAVFMDIRQAHQELLALYEIVQTMGQSLNMQETADLIISKSKRIIDFATCVLYRVHPDGDQLLAMAASGPYSDVIQDQRMPLGSGISGAVAAEGRPSGIGRSARDDLELLLGPSAEECNLTEVISAPLACDSETIGALTFYRASNRPFTEDEVRLAATIARQASIAVNNARQHEQTKQSALTDQLTGLANARYFFMSLEQELSRAREDHTPVSLVAVDLDNFKQINDSFGHQQGDRVLKIVAEIFRRYVRDTDIVVRYAGDEFFIITPNTNNKAAVETANRIKAAIRSAAVEMHAGRAIHLGASFGVATFPGDAEDAQSLIAIADRAMYADKKLSHQAQLLADQEEPDVESRDIVPSSQTPAP